MSTIVVGTPYSPPSPPDTSSSETMSPTYPDRPIRPLPKRSLRERLSPEVADTILYPPAPPSTNPLFYSPYSEASDHQKQAIIRNAVSEIDKALIDAQSAVGVEERLGYQFRGNEAESDEEDGSAIARRYDDYHRMVLPSSQRYPPYSRNSEHMAHSVASSNDSADGYDSFENTNNKKKRKIPTSGNLHPSLSTSLSSDLANMGLSGSREAGESFEDSGVGQYYGSGSSAIPISGTGISGAGRGRYGRPGRRDPSQRSPLGVSTNGNNAWQMGRFVGGRKDHVNGMAGKATESPIDHGIISQAIAEAAALPTTPEKGQENVSLLEQQSTKRSTPAKTQFTFTCETDASKGMAWPGDQMAAPGPPYQPAPPSMMPASQLPHNQRGVNTQGTQTSPSMAGQHAQNDAAAAPPQQPAQAPRKPRRPPSKRYAIAARERRMQQEYNNYHHPPKEEDLWICEFCEYESIFGSPPEALVRQYEIKDRRERKRLAEKRRLLEKAKMKGRKGKKGSKNATKNGAANTQPAHNINQQDFHQQSMEHPTLQNHVAQDDDYYEEEYDDDPIPMPAPPQAPSKIPAPIAHQYGANARPAHGTGAYGGGGGGGAGGGGEGGAARVAA